ncbi:MAG TPA: DNA polymerase III subunit gamma/tau, partial [Polyangiaceae bacterium]|nr:DNA polymerase III subunit gamma/tau [Polyangiaceae bacterium]
KARAVRPAEALVATVRAFVALVREQNPGLAAHLEHGGPLEASPARLALAYERDAFSAVSVAQPEHQALLLASARAVLGDEVAWVLDTTTPVEALPMSLAGLDAEARRAALERAREAVATHPLVRKAIELFDAELRDVRLPNVAD